jgi:aldehyde:ferredoxin oxidoreductase
MSQFAYAGKILAVDLSGNTHREIPSDAYTGKYIGGRGLAAKLFWDMIPPEAGALEPENGFICATGPVTGFSGVAGSRWVICGRSPLHQPEVFSYGNLGGRWGATLKYAGYDALVVTGKAEKPAYLYIHDGKVETKDASGLRGLSTFETIEKVQTELGKGVTVLAIGPAAENCVVFATAMADAGASVSGGMGSVMGSKNLKAIAVAGNKHPAAARPDKLKEITDYIRKTRSGTFDGFSPWAVPGLTRPDYCYNCGVGCTRQSYKGDDGRRYKLFCQASGVYSMAAMQYYKKPNEVPRLAVRLGDGYGLDSAVMAPLINWVIACYREGLITEEQTGLPLSQAGSQEFIEVLARKIALREGFGDALARGTLYAASTIGKEALKLADGLIATPTSETRDYDPRLLLTTALILATEPRRPISQLHGISGNIIISWCSWMRKLEGSFFNTEDLRLAASRFWGGPEAVDFSTYEGKGLAAKIVQDRSSAQESLILCDIHWPMVVTSAKDPNGHVGDPAIESRLYSAITGKETSEEELYRIGERIFNLQRAIRLHQGWGGRQGDSVLDYFFTTPIKQGDIFFNPDAVMPGKNGELISRLGSVLDRKEFERMKDDYYRLRGWDTTTGFPITGRLNELGLKEVADDLKKRGLAV